MPDRIRCRTLFDITATGIRSNYKTSRIPCVDNQGNKIQDLAQWNKARNQQRNWETLNQLISLRSLPEEITEPILADNEDKKYWEFEFTVPSIEALMINENPVSALEHDCCGVPMILGLNETPGVSQTLEANTQNSNVWFTVVVNK